jgi:hypothetical protein
VLQAPERATATLDVAPGQPREARRVRVKDHPRPLADRRRAVFVVLLLLLGGVVLAARHVMTLANTDEGDTREFAVVFVGAFLRPPARGSP